MCFHTGVLSAKSKTCCAKPARGGALTSGSAFADRSGIREDRGSHVIHLVVDERPFVKAEASSIAAAKKDVKTASRPIR